MFNIRFSRSRRITEPIEPDEIFLDSSNLPAFDTQQFEGRLEKPIGKLVFLVLGGCFLMFGLVFLFKVGNLQLARGAVLAERSRNNTLHQLPVSAERGIITDRRGVPLAWNDDGRQYREVAGLAHVVGYVSQPEPRTYQGRAGAEAIYDSLLRGESGVKIEELDAHGTVHSSAIFEEPKPGQNLSLSIDTELGEEMYRLISNVSAERGFSGGGGIMMDVQTGEILALVSFPEYPPAVLAKGQDQAAVRRLLADPLKPFLNRVFDGYYTPGSIVKPFIAVGALNEGIISPDKKILSTGELVVDNPFFPDQPSVFKDWKAHGWVDLRQALAVSSNVYFYTIGGGFGDQVGLGIRKIDYYANLFGLGRGVNVDGRPTGAGIVPTPEWKAENFHGEGWRLGDTYHTAIGQYGFQLTPLQIARGAAAIATSGRLVYPTLLAVLPDNRNRAVAEDINGVKPEAYQIVREGMRQVIEAGTSRSLDVPYVKIAAKTGTAELGLIKADVNSWIMGFFPYEAPRYAFAVVMEKGSRNVTLGASLVIRDLLEWLHVHRPEYLTV